MRLLFCFVATCLAQNVFALHHYHDNEQSHEQYPYHHHPDYPAAGSRNNAQFFTEQYPAGSNARSHPHSPPQQNLFHVPRRMVPMPRVNRQVKLKFLKVFHHDDNSNRNSVSACPEVTDELRNQSRLPPNVLNHISQLCPCNTFFYSFADRHLNATRTLQRAFVDRVRNITNKDEKADALLEFAKHELHLRVINRRVWYYALFGAFLELPELSGYYLASALDATPDLYIPFSILKEATAGTRRPIRETTTNVCQTANGNQSSEKILEGRRPPRGQQGQRPGNGQGQQQGRPVNGQNGQQQQNGSRQANNWGSPQGQPASFQVPQRSPEDFQGQQGRPGDFQGQQVNPGDFQGQQVELGNFPGRRVALDDLLHGQFPWSNLNQQILPRLRRSTVNFSASIVFEAKGRRNPLQQQSAQQQQSPFPESPRPEKCIRYAGTQGSTPAENQLWYFREDVMVNQHHWNWHQYYPTNATRHSDRRGELFYFVHHQIMARYNAERLSNGLQRESSLDIRQNGNLGPGYDPDLAEMQSGRFWTPRPANTPLGDIAHLTDPDFQLAMNISELADLYSLLMNHVSGGYLLYNRTLQEGQPPTVYPLPIRNQEGFNHLGNTVEASEQLSTSVFHYNDTGVHNLAHIAVGLAADPDYRCQRPTGVMADLSVTMRDPSFYKVHTLVDDLFDHYKRTLPPYQLHDGEWPLVMDGVRIINLETFDFERGGLRNQLTTYWSIKMFPLEQGIDYSVHTGDVDTNVCHVHLNHSPFTFQLTVDVQNVSSRGTVRIFMAPRHDLNGRQFTMNETRRLMFQLDAFPVELRRGRNIITRNAQDSSSTKPWSRNIQEMLRNPDNNGQAEYCGCGWPDHLYIPKGSVQGMEFDLFAMITNQDQDQVQNRPQDLRVPEPCNSPYLFCGVPFRRYPDARPMGYPFDRLPYSKVEGQVLKPVNWLEEYVQHVPNMYSSVVKIQHQDTIK